jgi:hypothetical protein
MKTSVVLALLEYRVQDCRLFLARFLVRAIGC